MHMPFYGAASIPKADRRILYNIQPTSSIEMNSQAQVPTMPTKRKRIMNSQNGGTVIFDEVLKKD